MSTHPLQFQASRDLFHHCFSPASFKGQFNRSLSIFKQILDFETVTRGGGDADLIDDPDEDSADEDAEEYEARKKVQCRDLFGSKLAIAKNQGFNVSKLTITTVEKWYEWGWYDLFNLW